MRRTRPLLLPLMLLASCGDPASTPVLVRVRVENVSSTTAIMISNGTVPLKLPPGAWVVSSESAPLFAEGEADRKQGLEALAEDGAPFVVSTTLTQSGYSAGTFELRDVTYENGAIGPGEAFVFDVYAVPGDRLHIATMLGESNDWFYGTVSGGIVLFDGNTVRTADVSDRLALFDLGTEEDEPLGEGPNQAPRQDSAGEGVPEDGVVTRVSDSGAPEASAAMRVTIAPAL